MGAYLSEPMTQKESEDGEGNKLKFGACSMQGWRISQEDAHNCVAAFDENSSLFAVYDGHGGAEVAIYLSKHLPDMLKACVSYKNGEYVKALEECYLKIDASIKTPEVLKEIQQLAKSNKGDNDEAAVDYEEENVGQLYEEATMPLDKLVAKYSHSGDKQDENAQDEDPDCKPGSSKSLCSPGGSSSSSKAGGSSAAAGSSSAGASGSSSISKSNGEPAGSSSSAKAEGENGIELIVEGKKIELEVQKEEAIVVTKDETIVVTKEETIAIEIKGDTATPEAAVVSSATTNGTNSSFSDSGYATENGEKSKEVKPEVVTEGENGDKDKSTNVSNGVSDKSEVKADTNGENGEKKEESTPTPRRKKVHPVRLPIPEEAKKSEVRSSPRKTGRPISFVAAGCLDNSDDSEDSEEDAGYNVGDNSSDDVDDEEEDLIGESEEDEDDDEEEYEDDDEEEDERFLSDMQEPGFDSGATAVVCFMKWEGDSLSLWVANAGDSRCVVCREGKAIDMSHDHKPELDVEAQRIVKAGGKVTEDGRVNGGLNLSRALGDHSYKQNDTLSPEEQMISPLPDVEHIVLNPSKDKFLVLACDGIWNSMSSQQVVDFVGSRMDKDQPLSKICEELFDACLAHDTCGDGTGCDNMTCVIVQLSGAPEIYSGSKRKLSPNEDVVSTEVSELTKKSRVEAETVVEQEV